MINPVFIVIFNFMTGTGSLIYGVELLSKGLEKANPDGLRKILLTCTGSVLRAFTSGTLLTALVQSSTAITVITVGLVNSGLITLTCAAGIIYGANIGTTLTAQLMSVNFTDIGWPALVMGIIVIIFSKKSYIKNLGKALTGLGFMFIGLNILNSGVPYIKDNKFVYNAFLNYGNNPFAGLLLGTVTTMLVHSSSATVGLTIVLFNAGLISFEASAGLILGDNIGTCITAQVASIGKCLAARRTAWAHTLYNIIGVVLVLVLFKPFINIIKSITSILGQNKSHLIANAHTVFNVLSAVVFLPVNKYYIKLVKFIIPDNKQHISFPNK